MVAGFSEVVQALRLIISESVEMVMKCCMVLAGLRLLIGE